MIFDYADIRGMRMSHFKQLLALIEMRDRSGWYYGNREQFEKRHKELKEWVEGIIDREEKV